MESAPKSTPRNARMKKGAGEFWALGSVLGYSGANLFGRAAVVTGNPLAGPLLRDLPSLAMGISLLLRGHHYRQLQAGHAEFAGRPLLVFIGSGLISTLGTFSFFIALQLGGVNIVVPVLQTQIIWGAIFGWWLLREAVSTRGILGIIVTVAGLAILSIGQSLGVPASDSWGWGLLLALVPAVAWGFTGVIWRYGQQRGVDRSSGITVHYGTSVAASVIFLLTSGNWVVYQNIRPGDLTALAVSGILGGVVAVYCMFTAMKLLPAATVLVLSGVTPLVTALGGAIFLGEFINTPMWLGILMTSAGVVIFQISGVVRVKPHQKPSSPAGG